MLLSFILFTSQEFFEIGGISDAQAKCRRWKCFTLTIIMNCEPFHYFAFQKKQENNSYYTLLRPEFKKIILRAYPRQALAGFARD
jgi:hypothetical protein